MGERLMTAVLAGGEGRRMGGVKALRTFRGGALLAHAVAQARGWSRDVVVVVREPAQAGGLAEALIHDRADIDGPLAGLAAALDHARNSGAALLMTLPVDMPDLPPDLPDQLGQALGAEAKVALPLVAGRLEPTCGLWRVQALDALPAYLATGRSALHGFAEAAGLATRPFADEAAFANANTVEALKALDRRS